MRKLISKIAGLMLGLSLAVGVGVSLSNHKTSEVKAESVTLTQSDFSSSWTTTQGAQTGTSKGFTLTSTSGVYNSAHLRHYAGATLTLSSSVGNMTEVVFTCTANGTANYGPGKMSGDGYVASSGKTGTWTGNADSFSLTGGQSRITSIAITYTASSSPSISLSDSKVWLVDEGSAKSVTVSHNNFTSTPTISVEGTPSYVTPSVNGLTVSLTPKAVGSETITIKGTYGTQTASKTLDIIVYDKHGLIESDPFSVAEAKAAIDAGGPLQSVYVSGIISQIDTPSSFSGQICYWISDDGTTDDQFEIYWGRGLNNQNFTALTDIELGATIVNFGNIKKYNSTYEFDSGSYLKSYSAPALVLSSISLGGTYQTSFEQYESFNYEGLEVTANYEGGSSKVVTPTSVSSPDMSSTGQKTVTVTYTENDISKTAEYSIQVTAPIVKHTISFLPGDGDGSMESVQVNDGASYDLPECTFTAPEGKKFAGWTLNGTDIVTSLESVTSDVSVTALWIDKPAEATTDYDFSSSIPEEWVASMDKTTTDTSLGRGIGWGAAKGEITLTLSNSDEVSSVVITASTNNAGNTLSVTVGETAYGSAQEIANGTDNKNKEYTFSGSSSGDIVITVNDSAKTVWVLKVSVTTVGGTPQPEKVLTGITVSGAKTDFTVGESFATTGLIVTAHYEDAADAVISSGFTVDSSLVNSSAAGTYKVTVSYQTKSDSYDVTYLEAVPPTIATYKKVETNLADFSGSYLVVYESSETAGYAFNGSLTTFDATSNGVAVEISSKTIELSDAYEFTVAKKDGGYSLKSKSGYYLGKTAYANAIDQDETDKYTNQFGYSEGVMAVHGEGNSNDDYVVLRYNSTSGQDRFRFMKNNGVNPISLYQKVDEAESLALDLLNMTYEVCSAGYDNQKDNFTPTWSTLSAAYNALGDEAKAKLNSVEADKNGVMIEEAMARYDLLTGKYGLTNFISDRTPVASAPYVYSSIGSNNSSTIIIVVVALTSITSIGVLLVIKRKRSLIK